MMTNTTNRRNKNKNAPLAPCASHTPHERPETEPRTLEFKRWRLNNGSATQIIRTLTYIFAVGKQMSTAVTVM